MSTSKTVLVAGGTGGLGREVTLAFAQDRASVIVTYRKQGEFDAVKNHTGVEGFQLDVTDESAVRGLIDRVVAKYGQLDALINTVGGYVGGVEFWNANDSVFEQMLALNLRSGYVLSRAVVPVMMKQGFGSVVNISAKAALDHPAGASAYAASKAAAIAMMDSLAADLRGTGVRVNSVLPSIIDTEANRKAMPRMPIFRNGQSLQTLRK
jgi:NAD(P)-dependent dehydrogenase (short-subunit alcohol dehydrogenase family)